MSVLETRVDSFQSMSKYIELNITYIGYTCISTMANFLSSKEKNFLDLISESEEDISSLVKWLDCVAKASVSSFLHKRVDVVISDRDDTCRKRKTLNNLHTTCGADQKRSMIMLGMAASAERSGSSSVFSLATKWNMTVLKYVDVLVCMKHFNLASPHDHS